MANRKLTVNISVNSEIDAKKIIEKLYAEIAKEIEVKVEVAKEDEPLKVGDYAKVISLMQTSGNIRNDVELGDIGKIIKVDGSDVPFRFERISDGLITWFSSQGTLVHATDKEVAEAKRKLAEKAETKRWAAIGRKPGEFKKGDAVQYKKAFTTVVNAFADRVVLNHSNNVSENITVSPESLTLVFPVESRFE